MKSWSLFRETLCFNRDDCLRLINQLSPHLRFGVSCRTPKWYRSIDMGTTIANGRTMKQLNNLMGCWIWALCCFGCGQNNTIQHADTTSSDSTDAKADGAGTGEESSHSEIGETETMTASDIENDSDSHTTSGSGTDSTGESTSDTSTSSATVDSESDSVVETDTVPDSSSSSHGSSQSDSETIGDTGTSSDIGTDGAVSSDSDAPASDSGTDSGTDSGGETDCEDDTETDTPSSAGTSTDWPEGKYISIDAVYEKTQSGDPDMLLINVVDEVFYNLGHIEGSLKITWDTLADHLDAVDSSKHIVIYCRRGVRSESAYATLTENSYQHVWIMDGGIEAWSNGGYPTVP